MGKVLRMDNRRRYHRKEWRGHHMGARHHRSLWRPQGQFTDGTGPTTVAALPRGCWRPAQGVITTRTSRKSGMVGQSSARLSTRQLRTNDKDNILFSVEAMDGILRGPREIAHAESRYTSRDW